MIEENNKKIKLEKRKLSILLKNEKKRDLCIIERSIRELTSLIKFIEVEKIELEILRGVKLPIEHKLPKSNL